MRKQLAIVTTATLLMGTVLLVLQRQHVEQEESAGGWIQSKSGRSGSSIGNRDEAFTLLRTYRSGNFEDTPTFDKLDALARGLSDAELLELVEGETFLTPGTIETWVKCAAYAELGRRDPENTLKRILEGLEKQEVWLMDNPVLFSIFRGWAEVDPLAAAQRLARTHAVPRRDSVAPTGLQMPARWKGEVYREIFGELARRDRGQAVDALSWVGVQNHTRAAWEGIFGATGSPEKVRDLLTIWEQSNELNTVDLSNRFAVTGLLLGDVDGGREGIVLAAAQSIAESDLVAALELLREKSPMGSRGGSLPAMVLLEEYGRRHPEEALGMIRNGESGHLKNLALGIARSNLESLEEVMEALEGRVPPVVFLGELLDGQGESTLGDQLPRPGQGSRLANYEERFAQLRIAIQQAVMTPEEESLLLNQLEREFIESNNNADGENQ